MAVFWRVITWSPDAPSGVNGHPLFIWPWQGQSRIDDPQGEYQVLYVGDCPEVAVAEALGRFQTWSSVVLDPAPAAPAGSVRALVAYEGEPVLCDLDDPHQLGVLGLRPSRVVTRKRAVTQAGARAVYDTRAIANPKVDGISWWSSYDPDWASIGLWRPEALTVVDVEPLTVDLPATVRAAEVLLRLIE